MLLNDYSKIIHPLGLKDGKFIPLEYAALGLAGEMGELLEAVGEAFKPARDEADLKRKSRAVLLEAGDVLWYVNAIAYHFDMGLEELDGFMRYEAGTLTIASARVCDAIKKQGWHGSTGNRMHMFRDLSTVLANVRNILQQLRPESYVLEDAAEANVEKLRRRYPEGFVEGGGNRNN